ncbi:Alpha-glucosidase [subsurface metagenome]
MGNYRIVLIGAGSTSFGPSMLTDIFSSDVLQGSTIILHDIDKEKLEIIYDLIIDENEKLRKNFIIERTINRQKSLKGADFVINSIEVGDRMKLWRQDYEIPRNHGSTQILGECGGPGGTFHAFRIIPPIIEIVKDVERICPNAFLINFSNPMSRVCLAIKRCTKNLKFVGLCHQIGYLNRFLPKMFNKKIEDFKITAVGLNHFGFLIGLEDFKTGKSLMPKFNNKALKYLNKVKNRFEYSELTFEVFKRFGYFSYACNNHLNEYLQFGEEFTETQDMIDWIDHTDQGGKAIYDRIMRFHRRFKKGTFKRMRLLPKRSTGERAIPIIEAIITGKKSYESSVNIPNDGFVDNLPQDLIIEGPVWVDGDGVHGIKIGNLPKGIAALLRIEACVQDLCIDAVIKRSREIALQCLTVDPNVGNTEMAEAIFNEMVELQKDYLPKFK